LFTETTIQLLLKLIEVFLPISVGVGSGPFGEKMLEVLICWNWSQENLSYGV